MKKQIIPVVSIILISCVFFLGPVIPAQARQVIFIVAFVALLSSMMVINRQGKGPYLTKIMTWLAALLGLSFGLFFITSNLAWMLIAAIGIPLTILWLNYLRFPPQLWRPVWLFRRNKQAEALHLINDWIKSHPNDWKVLSTRSDIYLMRFQFADAERDARLAIRLKPDFHEAYNQLGRSLIAQGLYEEAQQALESAERLHQDKMYRYNIGVTQYRRGKFTEAVDSLTKSTSSELDIKQFNLLANYYLGKALEAMGEPEKATKAFQKMQLYKDDLRPVIENLNHYPDYIETIAFREDLTDIQQRLSK